MVLKKSEYQNQFKSSVALKHQATYAENLALRYQRRDREFLHTPICWGDSSPEEEPSSSDNNEDLVKPVRGKKDCEPEVQYQSLAEILADAKEKTHKHRHRHLDNSSYSPEISDLEKLSLDKKDSDVTEKQPGDSVNIESTEKNVGNKACSIHDVIEAENHKLHKKLAKTYAITDEKFLEDIDSECDIVKIKKDLKTSDFNLRKKKYTRNSSVSKGKGSSCNSRSQKTRNKDRSQEEVNYLRSEPEVPPLPLPTRWRRPDRQAALSRSRAKRRPVSSGSPAGDRPPFLAYGSADVENSLALHRTHNVRCPADVYVPALRAKTRREEDRRQQRARRLLAKSTDDLLDRLSAATPRDQFDWRSEYQKQFHAYSAQDYERAVSMRAVVPRSAPVRAVHRGGCLVVHVD